MCACTACWRRYFCLDSVGSSRLKPEMCRPSSQHARCVLVALFYQKYRLDHPEIYVFSLSKTFVSGSKYPQKNREQQLEAGDVPAIIAACQVRASGSFLAEISLNSLQKHMYFRYRQASVSQTGREYHKCPRYSGIRVIETQCSRRARFRCSKSVRVIADSKL